MNPLFIGGTGRCGTTILRRCLARHSKTAALPGELRIVVDTDGAIDLFRNLTSYWGPYRADYAICRFEKLLRAISSRGGDKYEGHQIDLWTSPLYWDLQEKFINRLVRYETVGNWTGGEPNREKIYESGPWNKEELAGHIRWFFEALFSLQNEEAEWWLDDTPYSIRHAERLCEIWPNMRMIHIYRHPYDVLASYNRIRTPSRRWTSGSTRENALRIKACYEGRQKMREWTKNNPDITGFPPIYDLRFENLVSNPEPVLRRIQQFLNIELEKRLDDPIDTNKAHVGRRGFDEQGLSGEDLEIAHSILGEIAKDYGYDI